jgi:hypothetical protein
MTAFSKTLQPIYPALELLTLPTVDRNPQPHAASCNLQVEFSRGQPCQPIFVIDDAAALAHRFTLIVAVHIRNWKGSATQ